jgi:UDP-2,3-diacylglucosamine hydrolase
MRKWIKFSACTFTHFCIYTSLSTGISESISLLLRRINSLFMSFQQLSVALQANKKIYFASDFHLGAPNYAASLAREREIVRWLEHIRADAQVLCLVGDLFDFWLEYRKVVPRGFVRFLGKLSELSDSGVEILIFPGNHDMWMGDYLPQEINAKLFRKPLELTVSLDSVAISPNQKHQFFISHGDGLGPGDYQYKVLKRVFENRLTTWAFKHLLHPNFALRLAHAWAGNSWQKHEKEGQAPFYGEEKEWLLHYAKAQQQTKHHDYYIFGHRHIELDFRIAANSRMLILGDWITLFTYAVFDGERLAMKRWEC